MIIEAQRVIPVQEQVITHCNKLKLKKKKKQREKQTQPKTSQVP